MMAAASTSLWMGDLDPYMDESFISMAFKQMGVAVKGIKVIKSKTTGLPAGYCFIDFHDPENAHQAMLKLNGKNIPNSSPVSVYQGQSSDPELGQYQTKLTANLSPTDDLYHVLNFIRQGQFSSVEYRLDSFLFPQSRLLMVF